MNGRADWLASRLLCFNDEVSGSIHNFSGPIWYVKSATKRYEVDIFHADVECTIVDAVNDLIKH